MTTWLETLHDSDPEIRQASATALGTPGNRSAIPALVDVLEHDPNQFVRGAAADALKQIGTTDLLATWERALQQDSHWYVRQVAIDMLKHATEDPVAMAVVYALVDEDASIRTAARYLLERRHWHPRTPEEQICSWLANGQTYLILNRGTHILPHVLQLQSVNDSLSGAIGELLPSLYATIDTVAFGTFPRGDSFPPTTWQNPDVEALTLPLSGLHHLLIDPVSAAFLLVERFLTYALNYLGQRYVRHHVEVHIEGDVSQLHPILRNNLTSFCRIVHIQE
jgi:hypothetical protein